MKRKNKATNAFPLFRIVLLLILCGGLFYLADRVHLPRKQMLTAIAVVAGLYVLALLLSKISLAAKAHRPCSSRIQKQKESAYLCSPKDRRRILREFNRHLSSDDWDFDDANNASVGEQSIQINSESDVSLVPAEHRYNEEGLPLHATWTTDSFEEHRNNMKADFPGVYLLENRMNGKCYVGQSIHVMQRLSQHFSGHGCPDFYVDYRLGQPFTIRVFPLFASGFNSLDALEKALIGYTSAYTTGYNRTRGNG